METTDANADGTEAGRRSDADRTETGDERGAAADRTGNRDGRGADESTTDAFGWLRGRVLDLLVVTGWTVGVALLFLETGWPRWAFYAAVLGGAIWFAAALTPGPERSDSETDQRAAGESPTDAGG